MAYVTPIYGGSAAQIDYRLGLGESGQLGQHGCGSDAQFRYRADARERPLRWIGEGLPEFGIEGVTAGAELTAEQHDMARALMAGKHPVTGEQLMSPKLAVPADAKVPLGPLVAEVRALAAERGVGDPVDVFTTPKQRSAWNTAVRAVARRGDAASMRIDDALALTETAGLEAERVWPDTDLLETYGNLYQPAPVVDEHGTPVLAEDGTPKTELAPRRVPVGIVGFDIGVTLPKSASLLLAFLPEDMADRVEAGYTAAIDRTFSWVEGRTSYVRRGKHGDGHTARHEPTKGFSGWVMTHRAARPVGDAAVGDPHWHVHITVANMAKATDGTWLTVAAGGRDLMRHAPAIDKVTQAQVRGFLHDQFGITFTRRDRSGVWEIAQIPDEAIVYFSKRGRQVGAVLAQLGYSNADISAAQARVLTRESRSAKSETTADSDATLRGLWRADAFHGGLDPDSLMDQVLTAGHSAHRAKAGTDPAEPGDELGARFGISLDDLVTALTDPERGLTAHTRRFSHLDAIAAVADALPHGAGIEEVERLTDLAMGHPAFVALPTGAVQDTGQTAGQAPGLGAGVVGGPGVRSPLAGAHQMAGGQLYSTSDVTDAEATILAHATAPTPGPASRSVEPGAGAEGRHQARPVAVPPATVDLAVTVVEAAQGFPLSDEQRSVLAQVVTSGRPVQTVEGPPGTGKTTLMRAARVAWESAGYQVAGAATAAVAAQNLAAESGIPSRTVAQWLWRITNGTGLAGVDVLVLDEANLTSDRDRAALYTAAAETGTQIVEVGDPRQLRGVGEGSMFGYLHALVDGPRLTENRRQRRADERAALAAFREGRHAEALHTYQRIGGLVATETADEAVAAMVTTWLRTREGAPDPHTLTAGLVMLAATNEQVDRINDATQVVRHARGELGATATYRLAGGGQARFHVGDLVLLRRNDRHEQAVTGAPVLNGYRGVVTAITGDGVEVTWHTPGTEHTTKPTTKPTVEPSVEPSAGAAVSSAESGEAVEERAAEDRAAGLSRAVLSPGFIARGGLELGYALTAHKAEGLTVDGQWDRPDGSRNEGTVLVYGPGMDNPGLYVSMSRDKGQAILFGARAELEGDREDLLYGPPSGERALTDRVIAALAEHANATADHVNDRPVLVDLGHAPANPAPADPPSTTTSADAGTSTGAGAAETKTPARTSPHPPGPVPVPENAGPSPHAARHEPTEQPQQPQPQQHPSQREPATPPTPASASAAVSVSVSEEQRQQWRDLVRRAVAARVADDRDTYRALLAERHALAEELGPDRVALLRQESHQAAFRAAQRQAERRAEQQRAGQRERLERLRLTAQWQNRPHSRLPDRELDRAIRDAERRADREHAAAEKARQDLADREPAVAAGRGPRVTELDNRVHQLRVNAERQGTVEALEHRWQAAVKQAGDAAAQAGMTEHDADRTAWWQSGKRERLQAEAAAHRAVVDKASKEAAGLARHAAELQHQLGGRGLWRQARQLAERAEATYPHDRAQALQADRHDLTRLRDRAQVHDTAAGDARTRQAELHTEQRLRETMPEHQRALEHQLRVESTQHQAEHTAPTLQPDRALHPDLPSIHRDLEHHIPHDLHHQIEDQHIDRGPGLGL